MVSWVDNYGELFYGFDLVGYGSQDLLVGEWKGGKGVNHRAPKGCD